MLRALPLALALLAVPLAGRAEDITVMISGGFFSSLKDLAPGFEAATGDHLVVLPGPSMGTTANAIPQRLARGEPDDVLIMVGYALDGLVKDGRAAAGSERALAVSPIGAAVRAGAPAPDISTVDKLRQALLSAKSVAYSDSASGVYIQNELFKKLGIEDQMRGKARMIPATPVGEIVAKGEAELGFQQVAELLPVPGLTQLGRLPDAVQQTTVFAAGVSAHAQHPDAARRLIAYLGSSTATLTLAHNGLLPPPH